jgi:hypothetical protein
MMNEELFEQWRQHQEAQIKHINDEIYKARSYLQCLYQLRDVAMLSSYPGGFKPTMKVENAEPWEQYWQGEKDNG